MGYSGKFAALGLCSDVLSEDSWVGKFDRSCRACLSQDGVNLLPQLVPRCLLLVGELVVQVVPPHPAASHHVVLAAVDDVGQDAQRLHHGGAGAPHVVRGPFAVAAALEDQCVVVGTA